jgi:hypothetical protein
MPGWGARFFAVSDRNRKSRACVGAAGLQSHFWGERVFWRRGSVVEVPGLQFRLFEQSRDVAQSGSALQWGCRGRGFKSRRPDWEGRSTGGHSRIQGQDSE